MTRAELEKFIADKMDEIEPVVAEYLKEHEYNPDFKSFVDITLDVTDGYQHAYMLDSDLSHEEHYVFHVYKKERDGVYER